MMRFPDAYAYPPGMQHVSMSEEQSKRPVDHLSDIVRGGDVQRGCERASGKVIAQPTDRRGGVNTDVSAKIGLRVQHSAPRILGNLGFTTSLSDGARK
jgi:hypothetical protein